MWPETRNLLSENVSAFPRRKVWSAILKFQLTMHLEFPDKRKVKSTMSENDAVWWVRIGMYWDRITGIGCTYPGSKEALPSGNQWNRIIFLLGKTYVQWGGNLRSFFLLLCIGLGQIFNFFCALGSAVLLPRTLPVSVWTGPDATVSCSWSSVDMEKEKVMRSLQIQEDCAK